MDKPKFGHWSLSVLYMAHFKWSSIPFKYGNINCGVSSSGIENHEKPIINFIFSNGIIPTYRLLSS